MYRRLGGPQGWSGQVRKISPPPGLDPRAIQPVASHYTDCATRPTPPQTALTKSTYADHPRFGKLSGQGLARYWCIPRDCFFYAYMSYGWGSPGETWRQTVTRRDIRPSHVVTSDHHTTWRQTVTRILRIRQRALSQYDKKNGVTHRCVGGGGSLRFMADESAWIIHRTAFNPTPASSAPSKAHTAWAHRLIQT